MSCYLNRILKLLSYWNWHFHFVLSPLISSHHQIYNIHFAIDHFCVCLHQGKWDRRYGDPHGEPGCHSKDYDNGTQLGPMRIRIFTSLRMCQFETIGSLTHLNTCGNDLAARGTRFIAADIVCGQPVSFSWQNPFSQERHPCSFHHLFVGGVVLPWDPKDGSEALLVKDIQDLSDGGMSHTRRLLLEWPQTCKSAAWWPSLCPYTTTCCRAGGILLQLYEFLSGHLFMRLQSSRHCCRGR